MSARSNQRKKRDKERKRVLEIAGLKEYMASTPAEYIKPTELKKKKKETYFFVFPLCFQ